MMHDKNQGAQDPYLNTLRRERTRVAIFLMNGVKLVGTVQSFDAHMVQLNSSEVQTIYKHSISTIQPLSGLSDHSRDHKTRPRESDRSPLGAKPPQVTTRRSRLRSGTE